MCEERFFALTNDGMFHYVMQESQYALKMLTASLLSKHPDEITSVEVKNPYDYGKCAGSKDIILDVKAVVNKDTVVNIEVQVKAFKYWRYRSLYYAARMAAETDPNRDYGSLPIIRQFSILNYTFDREDPGFFSTYELRNVENEKSFTDRFQISIMDLTQNRLATWDDAIYGRTLWADLFKANSWEKLESLALKNEVAKEVVEIMYKAVKDDETARFLTDRELARKERISIREEGRMEGMAQGMKKGMEKGIKTKNFEFAKNLLVEGFSRDDVRRLTNYPFSDEELDGLK
ncbi:Rpn family recombination-promoting nuclease/putative transposase [Peptococcus simiae]|uniref:Rpn family recombination-promoting nuclease/putative transposase n=1 Tax=Peptococcus simiae TaxID=1643805 RepID=UPI0039807E5A